MKRILFLFASGWMALSAWALHVECVGNAVQVVQDNDTIFLFDGQPHLRSTIGKVDWYRAADRSLIQDNTEETEMMDSGDGVMVVKEGVVLDVVYVFDYNQYMPSNLSIDATHECTQTYVAIAGTIPAITYVDTLAQAHTLAHKGAISYSNLAWNEENKQWADSAAVMACELKEQSVELPPIFGYTAFTLTWDKDWREALAMTVDSISTEVKDPLATTIHLEALATVRGENKENEIDRPTQPSDLTASGPLEVLFQSHPTPAVRFYTWTIYKSSELLTQRRDQDTRYTFYDPGTYRIVVQVEGDMCVASDSVTVTIRESQLQVPNAFTPNGDNINDEFRVVYRSLREYHIWIYNRWGKLVYESTDPARGWDGMIGNRPAAAGAYYYVIRAMGTDAQHDAEYHSRQAYEKAKLKSDESYIGIYQLSGDINLLR